MRLTLLFIFIITTFGIVFSNPLIPYIILFSSLFNKEKVSEANALIDYSNTIYYNIINDTGLEGVNPNLDPIIVLKDPFEGTYYYYNFKELENNMLSSLFSKNNLSTLLTNLVNESFLYTSGGQWNPCMNTYSFYNSLNNILEKNLYQNSDVNFLYYLELMDKIGLPTDRILFSAYLLERNEDLQKKLKENAVFLVNVYCKIKKKKKSYTKVYNQIVTTESSAECPEGSLIKTVWNTPICNGLTDGDDCYDKVEEHFWEIIENTSKEMDEVKEKYEKDILRCEAYVANKTISDFLLLEFLDIGSKQKLIPLDKIGNVISFFESKIVIYDENKKKFTLPPSLYGKSFKELLNSYVIEKDGEYYVDLGSFFYYYLESSSLNLSIPKDYPVIFIHKPGTYYGIITKQEDVSKSRYLKSLNVSFKGALPLLDLGSTGIDTLLSLGELYRFTNFLINNNEKYKDLIFLDIYLYNKESPSLAYLLRTYDVFLLYLLKLKQDNLQEIIDEIGEKVKEFENSNKYKNLQTLYEICNDQKLMEKINLVEQVASYTEEGGNVIVQQSTPSLRNLCKIVYLNQDPSQAVNKIKENLRQILEKYQTFIFKGYFTFFEEDLLKLIVSPEYYLITFKEDTIYNIVKKYYENIVSYLKKEGYWSKVKKDLLEYRIYFDDFDNLIPKREGFDLRTHIDILIKIISKVQELLNYAVKNKDQRVLQLCEFYKEYSNLAKQEKLFKIDIPKVSCKIPDVKDKKEKLILLSKKEQEIIDALNYIDTAITHEWVKKWNKIDKENRDLFKGLIEGDLKYNCKLKIPHYYNYKNKIPYAPSWEALFYGNVENYPLPHYKEIYEIISNLKNELKKCSVKVKSTCFILIPTQNTKDGTVKAELELLFHNTKPGYYNYEYDIDPDIASLFEIKPIKKTKELVNTIKKNIEFKLFNIKELEGKYVVSPALDVLLKKCKLSKGEIKITFNKKLANKKTKYYVTSGNTAILFSEAPLKTYIFEQENPLLKNIKDMLNKNYCVLSLEKIIDKENKIAIKYQVANPSCFLKFIPNLPNKVDEVFIKDKKYNIKNGYLNNPLFVKSKELIVSFEAKDNLKMPLVREILKKKRDETRLLKREISKNKEIRDIYSKTTKCIAQQKILAAIASIKEDVLSKDYRKELVTLDKYTDDEDIKSKIKSYNKAFNEFFKTYSQIIKSLKANPCYYPNLNQLNDVKRRFDISYNLLLKTLKQKYIDNKKELESNLKKIKECYDLANRLYIKTKDTTFKKISEDLSKYVNLKIIPKDEITVTSFVSFMKLKNMVDPSPCDNLKNYMVRQIYSKINKLPKQQIEKVKQILERGDLKEIASLYLTPSEDGKVIYDVIKESEERELDSTLEKRKLLLEVDRLKLMLDQIKGKDKRKLNSKLKEILNKINNGKLEEAKKNLKQLKEEINQKTSNQEEDSNNLLYYVVAGSSITLSLSGALLYFYLRKKKTKTEENKEEEEEEEWDV